MTIHTRTGKPLVKGLIEALARVDVLLSMCDAEDTEQFEDWVLHEGVNLSTTAKALLLASFNSSHSVTTTNKKEGQ